MDISATHAVMGIHGICPEGLTMNQHMDNADRVRLIVCSSRLYTQRHGEATLY